MAYTDLSNLSTDPVFNGRCNIAANSYATYILGEASGAANHAMRLSWAILAMNNLSSMVTSIMPTLLNDSNVVASLSAITDSQLSASVQTAVNTLFINAPVSYLSQFSLSQNPQFLQRLQFAVVSFAMYVLGEDPAAANHAARYAWAKAGVMNAAAVAQQLALAVVNTANVLAAMAGVTDANLQTSVETEINTLLI